MAQSSEDYNNTNYNNTDYRKVSSRFLNIRFKKLDGTLLSAICCTRIASVRALKTRIAPIVGFVPDEIQFVTAGQCLNDNKTLGDYGVKNNQIIHIVLNLRGD